MRINRNKKQDIFDEIIAVEEIGIEEVFDIEVDHPDHVFYANDVLVSNCFNLAHSVAYAIDSYYAAWLHTYYETDWLATVLESENGNPSNLAKSIAEIKSYGYQFSDIDINYSGTSWEYSDKIGAFVPPLSSVSGIGQVAMEEIMKFRPYKNIKDLLYDESGEWKHSKMNKTCLSALCKIGALSSLDDFQNGEVSNHKQILLALTEDKNYDKLKKGISGLTQSAIKRLQKSGEDIPNFLDDCLNEFKHIEDWSRTEKLSLMFEITSSVDANMLFPDELMKNLNDKNIKSILTIDQNQNGVGWFVITEVVKKQTKNKKDFYRLKITDNENRVGWLRAWGGMKTDPELFTIWMAHASNDSWGLSTSIQKMKKVI